MQIVRSASEERPYPFPMVRVPFAWVAYWILTGLDYAFNECIRSSGRRVIISAPSCSTGRARDANEAYGAGSAGVTAYSHGRSASRWCFRRARRSPTTREPPWSTDQGSVETSSTTDAYTTFIGNTSWRRSCQTTSERRR